MYYETALKEIQIVSSTKQLLLGGYQFNKKENNIKATFFRDYSTWCLCITLKVFVFLTHYRYFYEIYHEMTRHRTLTETFSCTRRWVSCLYVVFQMSKMYQCCTGFIMCSYYKFSEPQSLLNYNHIWFLEVLPLFSVSIINFSSIAFIRISSKWPTTATFEQHLSLKKVQANLVGNQLSFIQGESNETDDLKTLIV